MFSVSHAISFVVITQHPLFPALQVLAVGLVQLSSGPLMHDLLKIHLQKCRGGHPGHPWSQGTRPLPSFYSWFLEVTTNCKMPTVAATISSTFHCRKEERQERIDLKPNPVSVYWLPLFLKETEKKAKKSHLFHFFGHLQLLPCLENCSYQFGYLFIEVS